MERPWGGTRSNSCGPHDIRMIYAIDGLRKSTEEDTTSTKGVLTSLREGERLDVFLTRGSCEAQSAADKWPVLIPNPVALAIAGLRAADCPIAKTERIEGWTPPNEHKIEARGKPPPTVLAWLRQAENAIQVFGSAYGLEHLPERMAFLQSFREIYELDENACSADYCIRLFEEIMVIWCAIGDRKS